MTETLQVLPHSREIMPLSEFVRKTVGTGNVCERAAVLAGGELIIKKTAVNGVTVAASVQERRIEF